MRPLRIFYAAHPSLNAIAFPENQLWHHNLFLPLVDLGHDVIPFDYDLTPTFQHLDGTILEDRAFITQNRPRLEDDLLRQIEAAHKEEPIDVFFSYFYSACASAETIRAIGDLGIATVNWYCNAAHQFHLVEEVAPGYHYCLVPEEFRMADYRRIGANPIYSQEAANPMTYKPYPLPVEYDVIFVGQKYGDRPQYIRHLLDAGVNVRVWGPHWLPASNKNGDGLIGAARRTVRAAVAPFLAGRAAATEVMIPPEICGPSIVDANEYVKMYSRAKISLGFSTCGETHASGERILQVRLRDFEAPMCGAFYMVEYMPELEHFFEIGKEIVCYSSAEELADKARYYLAHDGERETIRAAGLARSLRDHTWQRRFEVAFAKMGLG
jgi:spore maturation protein CgeB